MPHPGKVGEKHWPEIYKRTLRKLLFLEIGANMAGAAIVSCYFVFFDKPFETASLKVDFTTIAVMCAGLVVLAIIVLRYIQKDVVAFVQLKAQNRPVHPELQKRAQRRLLDLPFNSAMMSLFNWLLAAVIMAIYFRIRQNISGPLSVLFLETARTFIGVVIAGLVTCAIVYFSVEIVGRRVWPYFFTEGGIAAAPCTFRMRLPHRMLIIFVLTGILPIMLMAVLSYNTAELMLVTNPQEVIHKLFYLTAFLLATALTVAIILSRLFSASIVGPVSRMEAAMAKVGKGDLTVSVAVENNDELGALAEHFNQMADGLRERYELRRSLDLAAEVQQNLLPKQNPDVEGLDIAGMSIYCDETGGDYFDFLDLEKDGQKRLGVVVGDVSEHGIPSALLMATARALVRQRSALPGDIASVVSDVNQQLTRDVEDTGRFMTLFYLLVDPFQRSLHWVRAGHDAAILYDPATDRFEDLKGDGLALGVNTGWSYREYEKKGLTRGQIILVSTDGIWETLNPQGEMFGKEPIYEIVRRNHAAGAPEILEMVINKLKRFQRNHPPQDDVTLVVIRITT